MALGGMDAPAHAQPTRKGFGALRAAKRIMNTSGTLMLHEYISSIDEKFIALQSQGFCLLNLGVLLL